jgi:metallo-beta-lactamase family protein
VRASVHTFGGLSGHAGQNDLLNWFETLAPVKPRLVLTHGEDKARQTLAGIIAKKYKIKAELPALRQTIEID